MGVFACAFLQLLPGVFAIFYHYASAKNSRDKTLDLSSYFIIGAEMMTAVILFLLYFVISNFLNDNPNLDLKIFQWIVSGILLMLGFFVLIFYYRKGEGTKLFISRKMANNLTLSAKNAKKPSDIFTLGMTTGLLELFFTLPIYVVIITEIIKFPGDIILQPVLALLFVIISILPAMVMRSQFYRGRKNLADIERARVKNKNFCRIMIGVSYILLAIFIISFRIFK